MASRQAQGRALEARVAKIARRSGKSQVKRNVFLTDMHGNRSEIDVVFGRWPFRKYVECKAYSKGNPVPLEDVAKFKEVLRLNKIPPRNGIVVTTSKFSPRCKHVGVSLIDGVALRQWEQRAFRGMVIRRSILLASFCGAAATLWRVGTGISDVEEFKEITSKICTETFSNIKEVISELQNSR